jgi:peptidoglycan hydrolase CwlO-like protein
MKTMRSRSEYISNMQAKLDDWNTDIDTLTASAGESTTELLNRSNDQIESLKLKLEVAWNKIEQSRFGTTFRERD